VTSIESLDKYSVITASGTETVSLTGSGKAIYSESYIISGSGWGHNVGMSSLGPRQWPKWAIHIWITQFLLRRCGNRIKTSDFKYNLPEELIAQTPICQRDASRLMLLSKNDGTIQHSVFSALPAYLRAGDCVVFNDSRVIPARLFGKRKSGGAVEVLLLSDKGGGVWECLTRPGRRTPAGTELVFGGGELTAEVVGAVSDGNKLISFKYEGIFLEILERLGKMPLPPYIKEELRESERYQTVYSRNTGSAAAPTAGLHFTPELLERLEAVGVALEFVTLHVGLGTFRPSRPRIYATILCTQNTAKSAQKPPKA
jgi:S-adenosylmethionine:tRNA ribosyltransferase-isomerase